MEVDYIFDLDDKTLAGMMLFAKRVAAKIRQEIACKRVAVVVLGLEVPHAHIHLIPYRAKTTWFPPRKAQIDAGRVPGNCSKTLRIRSCLQKYNYLYYKRIVGY